MSKDNVVSLVNWDSDTALALAQQILEHVQYAMKKGTKIGIAVCVVTEEKPGSNFYTPAFSHMPMECAAWAGEMLKHTILTGDVDRKPPQS